jgi:ABC-type lipoprotein release transport system permease subunit
MTDVMAKAAANQGHARRTLISVAIGCLVTAAVFTLTASPTSSTVRSTPGMPYDTLQRRAAARVLSAASEKQEPRNPAYALPGADDVATDVTTDSARNAVPQVLLSRQLMREAGVHVGDLVTLAADSDGSRSASFRIVGVYEPTPDPRKFSAQRLEARLHLSDLSALAADTADPGSADVVSGINLALVDKKDADLVAGAIVRRAPGTRVASTEASDDAGDPFVVLDRFHWAIAIVTVTGSTAFLLALMVMRAEQRRDIIGILRLIGVSSRSILLEVLLEGLLIAVAGAVFGILVAVAAQGAINRFFQWRFDTTLVFVQVTATIAWEAVAFAVPLGVAAGLAASWTLLRRSVVSLVGR